LYGLDDHVLHIMHITGRFLVPVPCSGVTKGAASHWGLLWFACSLDWEGLGLLWDPEFKDRFLSRGSGFGVYVYPRFDSILFEGVRFDEL